MTRGTRLCNGVFGLSIRAETRVCTQAVTSRTTWHGHCQRMGGDKTMKKIIATFISLVIMSMAALPAAAQTRTRDRSVQTRSTYRNYDRNRSDNYRYRNDDWRYEDDRSVWDKHRDKITTAGGAAGGAILGGLIGGKKGAIIGAITGGAGAAVYTYKIRDKDRRRY
jgi:outer membrane lipoprotein SlyB